MPLREVILHNFSLKVFSLGLGALIWLGVHYQIQPQAATQHQAAETPHTNQPVFLQANFRVRVSVISPGDGKAYRVTPREVSVAVLGEEAALRHFALSNLMVYADLTDASIRKSAQVELHAHAPSQVIIGAIQPSTVTVEPTAPGGN